MRDLDPGRHTVRVSYDGTALVALLVQNETGWLLDDLQPVDGPDAAGAP